VRKQSQMGASKYEFNPEQFDIDVENNRLRYEDSRELIHAELTRLMEADPVRLDETFSIMLDVMREFKKRYNL
jgi:hypothetical protein